MDANRPSTIRLFGLVTDSIVDGIGMRVAIFTQGCPHACPGCHNVGSHDPNAGTQWNIDDVEKKFSDNPLLDGITLSGGEPFEQPDACAQLANRAHQKGLTVWAYTGYRYEELQAMSLKNEGIKALLMQVDVLIDGRFILAKKSLDLLFCGSSNQRLIDMNATKQAGEVVLYIPPQW